MKKTIVCFGDSNTYGDSPERLGRYPYHERWPGILEQRLGGTCRVVEEGLNGRTTVWEDPVEGDKCGLRHLPMCLASHAPLDLLILMLGTNDFKQRFHATPADVALGLERLVQTAQAVDNRPGGPFEILLVCPTPVRSQTFLGEVFGDRSADSARLAPLVQAAAERCGVRFLDMGRYVEASPLDGLHLDRENHRKAAAVLESYVREILGI